MVSPSFQGTLTPYLLPVSLAHQTRTCVRLRAQYCPVLADRPALLAGGAMDDARLFLCARCRRQVLICSVCDRGQQYCGARCSGLARDDSLRAAGRRYQQSRRGRHCHAERQRRYRRRRRDGVCREKVTHHGSAASRCGAPLVRQRVLRREASPSMSPKPVTKRARAASGTSKMQCHFCARPISEFVRLHWRRSPIRRRVRPGARR